MTEETRERADDDLPDDTQLVTGSALRLLTSIDPLTMLAQGSTTKLDSATMDAMQMAIRGDPGILTHSLQDPSLSKQPPRLATESDHLETT